MSQTHIKPNHELPPSTPRWVKVFGIVVLVVILLVVIILVTGIGGPHGPGRHIATLTPTLEAQQP